MVNQFEALQNDSLTKVSLIGASILSEPLRFTLDDQITSSHSAGHGSIIGGILAGLLAIIVLIVVAAFLFLKSKKLKNKNANGGVAFENPSYLRETNVEQVHVIEKRNLRNFTANNLPHLSHRSKQYPTVKSQTTRQQ